MRGEGLPELSLLPQREMTPLHMSAAMGHMAVVEQLLALGADKDAKDKVRGACWGGRAGRGRWGNTHLFV